MSEHSDIDVKHVAVLARLSLSEDENVRFQNEISAILNYIDTIHDVDVSGVEPTAHATLVTNVNRDDTAGQTQDVAETLANAPASEDNMVRVPVVIEGGGH